ncbi:MAG: hypothetical protein SFU25_03115 [Candidatus Caenarcaniphilales bacterium]|nr:hypothetical protein [Candidatus Caenarcaniphilales bacterium]
MRFTAERTFLKDFKKIKDNRIRDKIQVVIENIQSATSLAEISNLELLQGTNDFYRIKFDYNYRIGIRFSSDCIELLRIGTREGFYKSFP